MRRITMILAGIVMAIGVTIVAPAPAAGEFNLPVTQESVEAPDRPVHQFDTNSFWACGATRLNNNYFVGHSWPTYIHPGGAYVRYECLDFYLDGSHETYNAALLWWNGQTSVVGTWYFCYLGEPCPDPHET